MFKPGDRVRCINAEKHPKAVARSTAYNKLREGEIYTVHGVYNGFVTKTPSVYLKEIRKKTGGYVGYFAERFVLAEPEESNSALKMLRDLLKEGA